MQSNLDFMMMMLFKADVGSGVMVKNLLVDLQFQHLVSNDIRLLSIHFRKQNSLQSDEGKLFIKAQVSSRILCWMHPKHNV